MGFRNFRDFNVAMLGKQVWRLATKPNSLVAKMYKAKYFSKTDILHATQGHNPSFIWRSLLEAKQLIMNGFRWRVGGGSSISILDQPWLLVQENPFITSPLEPLQNKTVASLICTDKKEWDIVITNVLNERDQKCVLNIPLSNSNYVDFFFWNLEDSGVYSVMSAYKLLQTQKGDWCAEANDTIWRLLWSIKAPSKTLNVI